MPGFAWSELYTMPIDLRRFYYKCVVRKIERANEMIEKQNQAIQKQKARIPNVKPYKK